MTETEIIEAHAEYPCIDGLRAFAAVAVVLCHTVGVSSIITSTAGAYVAGFRAGVQIFFVVSGFVLYRPFAKAHSCGRRGPSLGAYFRRRVFRIFPAYWLLLTVGVFAFGVIHLYNTAAAPNYLLLQGYIHEQFNTGLGPSWTLCIEVSFYVFLPFYAWAVWSLCRGHVFTAELLGCGLLFVVGAASATWVANGSPPLFVTVLPANLTPFALGMAVASIRTNVRPRTRTWYLLQRTFRTPWKSWLVAVLAFVATVRVLHYPAILPLFPIPAQTQIAYAGLIDLMGLCVILPAVFGDQRQGVGRRVLSAPTLVFVGVVSYGIYLWHVPLMDKLLALNVFGSAGLNPPRVNFFAITALTLVLATAIATLSWFLLEKPLVKWAHHRHGGVSILQRWRHSGVSSAAVVMTSSTSGNASPMTSIEVSPANAAAAPGDASPSAVNFPAASVAPEQSAKPSIYAPSLDRGLKISSGMKGGENPQVELGSNAPEGGKQL